LKADVSYSGGSPSFRQAKPLFAATVGRFRQVVAGSKNGNRYLGIRPLENRSNNSLSVVINWPALLKKQ
jgi:hypothetical protein